MEAGLFLFSGYEKAFLSLVTLCFKEVALALKLSLVEADVHRKCRLLFCLRVFC